MPRADGVEERGNPVLNDHRIIRTGSRVKVKTVLEPFAASTRHRHPNTALRRPRPFHGLLNHRYRGVGQGEQRFLPLAEVSIP